MVIRLLAALTLVGFAVASAAYFFVYTQQGDWLYAHKDWLSIVSSLIAFITFVATLFGVIFRKKNKDQPPIQLNAGRDINVGDQHNTYNYGTQQNHSKAE